MAIGTFFDVDAVVHRIRRRPLVLVELKLVEQLKSGELFVPSLLLMYLETVLRSHLHGCH